ncbi:MAG: hypothetical protein IJ578_03890 [Bacteroidales bacterium]|nr:hypothetical protein [Bacteroidales bacterium]
MDIDLLSKMVKELILDKDEVALPGVGTFVAEMVPSSFADRGYTILPPYRRLFFRQRVDETDSSLVDFYADSNGIEKDRARRIVTDFLLEMRDVLKQKKSIVFPGLGKLRATRENHFFFVADEDLDIYPAGFGLEPISLKTHQETPEEVSSVVEQLRAILSEKASPAPTVEPVLEEEPVAEVAVTEPVLEEEPAAIEATEPESKPEPVAEAPIEPIAEPAAEVIAEPVAEVIPEPVAEEPVVEKAAATPVIEKPAVEKAKEPPAAETEAPKERAPWKTALWIALGLIGLLVLALVVFVILAHVAPDFIDSLLYSPEELEILHYPG